MNTKQIGNLSEIKIATRLIELGYTVSFPFGDNARYDLIFDKGNVLNRVQVKTGKYKNGAVEFQACSSSTHRGGVKKSYEGEVEYFGVYCSELDETYLVPIDIAPTVSMKLRVDPSKGANQYTVRYANDYKL